MRKKIIHLVNFQSPTETYALYEAVYDTDCKEITWISDEALKVFIDYKEAIEYWGKVENKYSGLLDIGEELWYTSLRAEIENEEEKEINF